MDSLPKPVSRQYVNIVEANGGQRVGLSEDEGSIVSQSSKSGSCGACRTRESKTWWKAPKGLPTNILCDNCGTNWRKYADLNVRPLREESLPSNKGKSVEKREGTPLAGPSAKRVKASWLEISPNALLRDCRDRHRRLRNRHLHPSNRLSPNFDASLASRTAQ